MKKISKKLAHNNGFNLEENNTMSKDQKKSNSVNFGNSNKSSFLSKSMNVNSKINPRVISLLPAIQRNVER